jgi:hypothetical protein
VSFFFVRLRFHQYLKCFAAGVVQGRPHSSAVSQMVINFYVCKPQFYHITLMANNKMWILWQIVVVIQ